jgi:hypothetical protein
VTEMGKNITLNSVGEMSWERSIRENEDYHYQ